MFNKIDLKVEKLIAHLIEMADQMIKIIVQLFTPLFLND